MTAGHVATQQYDNFVARRRRGISKSGRAFSDFPRNSSSSASSKPGKSEGRRTSVGDVHFQSRPRSPMILNSPESCATALRSRNKATTAQL